MRRTKANQAKSAFKTVVQTIEKLELEHTVNADTLEVFFTVRDMRLRMVVDPVRCLVRLRTPITNLPEDKRPGGAIIVTAINYSLIAGKFLLQGMVLWPTKSITIGAFLFSVVLGVIFGMYPAVKASGLQPVEALRAE